MIPWTKEEYERLRVLAQEGHTAKQAGVLLNAEFGNDRTRNAIIGACHRLHVVIGTPSIAILRAAQARRKRGPRRTKPKPIPRIVKEPAMPEPEPVFVELWRQGPPFSVADLTPRICRWIDGDPRAERPFACGEPRVREEPYCVGHLKRAFGPAPRAMRVTVKA